MKTLESIENNKFSKELTKNEMALLIGGTMPAQPLQTGPGETSDVDGICCNYESDRISANGTIWYINPVPNGKLP